MLSYDHHEIILLSVVRKMSILSLCLFAYNNFISFDACTNWNADFKISIWLFRLSSLVSSCKILANMHCSRTYVESCVAHFFLLHSFRFEVIALFLLFAILSVHLSSFVYFMCIGSGHSFVWKEKERKRERETEGGRPREGGKECLEPRLYALMKQIASFECQNKYTNLFYMYEMRSSFQDFQQNTTLWYSLFNAWQNSERSN